MVNFEMKSLILLVAVLTFILGVLLLTLKQTYKSTKGPFYWAIGSFSTATGLIVFAAYPWPSVYLNLLLTNLMIINGQCFILRGIWQFKEKKANYPLVIALPLISAIQVTFFTLIVPQPGIRMAINSVLYATYAFYAFYELLNPPEKALRKVFRINLVVYFIYGCMMLLRAVVSLDHYPVKLVSETPMNLLVFVSIIGLQTILVYGFIIMVNTRLAEDLKKQLAMRDQFLSIIAHDLKSPVNVISGFSDLLQINLEKLEIEKSKQFADYIKQSSIQMSSLLTNLLDWAMVQGKMQIDKPEQLNLNELIHEEITLNSFIAKNKHIKVDFVSNSSLVIYGSRNMLKTIMRNLIINAIKFTNPNGTITISVIPLDNFIEVVVSDSGIGIEPDILSRLFKFDKYVTTEGTENEKGSGLGLLLCKEFVEKHGGEIWVESVVEKGSTFRFTIPYYPG